MQSSDFVRHSYNYRPNWTPLGPVTIMITKGGEEKVNRNLKFKNERCFLHLGQPQGYGILVGSFNPPFEKDMFPIFFDQNSSCY